MKFIQAVLILSGMIIGVGMFGIPFSFAGVGFWAGAAELFLLAAVVLVFHLVYGEIVLGTDGLHRLPGYLRICLGKKAAFVSFLTAFFGIYGTLIAYILIGSLFLHNVFGDLFRGFNSVGWALVWAAVGALVTFLPLRKEAAINGILTATLVVFVLAVSFLILPEVQIKNLSGMDLTKIMVPYGVLLFSLAGGVVIPDLATVLGKDRRAVRKAIIIGTATPAVLYFIFAFAVVGASGKFVTEDGILGLAPVVGSKIVLLGSIAGILALFTSYTTLSASFQELFRLDLGFRKFFAWVAAAVAPFLLYVLWSPGFIAVIGAVGALAVGIDSALIVWAHHSLLKREGRKFSAFSYLWRSAIYVMMGTGIIYELYVFFK